MQERNKFHESAVLDKEPSKKLKFAKNSGFQTELRRRVDEFFQDDTRQERDCSQMYVKTFILLLSFFGLYLGLVLDLLGNKSKAQKRFDFFYLLLSSI